jgi:UDP-N-acetylglucosamine transferase subunit ALG13
MILVTVGVSNLPFDRLFTVVDDLVDGTEPVIAQYGAARVRPQKATAVDFLPFSELEEYVSKARVVVSHAGIGSVALCLSFGLHPIVVPRLQRLGECVDDHQLEFGRRVAQLGLATVIEDVADLAGAVRTVPDRQQPTGLSPELAGELVSYIEQQAGGRS